MFNSGYNQSQDCYGIPGRQHPEVKSKVAALLALRAEEEAEVADRWERMVEACREQDDAAIAAIEAEGPASYATSRAKRAEARAGINPDLYRVDGTTVFVRWDRTGKRAWDAEFARLGWTRGAYGWVKPAR